MKALFVDVETTGKADFRSPSDADHQPRIVQLAALLCDGEREVGSVNLIIKAGQMYIPEEASAIHGITAEMSNKLGVSRHYALLVFSSLARQADVLVAHNVDFDLFVLEGECRRMSVEFHAPAKFCTMREMTPICKLPGKFAGDFKWPKLAEAVSHAFESRFAGNTHDALADVRACKEVYFWLKNRVAPLPLSAPPPLVSTENLGAEMRKAVG